MASPNSAASSFAPPPRSPSSSSFATASGVTSRPFVSGASLVHSGAGDDALDTTLSRDLHHPFADGHCGVLTGPLFDREERPYDRNGVARGPDDEGLVRTALRHARRERAVRETEGGPVGEPLEANIAFIAEEKCGHAMNPNERVTPRIGAYPIEFRERLPAPACVPRLRLLAENTLPDENPTPATDSASREGEAENEPQSTPSRRATTAAPEKHTRAKRDGRVARVAAAGDITVRHTRSTARLSGVACGRRIRSAAAARSSGVCAPPSVKRARFAGGDCAALVSFAFAFTGRLPRGQRLPGA